MRDRLGLLLGLFAIAGAGYACGNGNDTSGGDSLTGGGKTTASGPSGGNGGTGGDGGGLVNVHGKITALTVTPPMATIAVTNGAATPKAFKAVARFEDGTAGEVGASWTIDRLDIAKTSSSGVVSALGKIGGLATLTASAGGQKATARITVDVSVTSNPAMLSQGDRAKFDSPDGTASGTLLYPYDKTVFARGILAPEVMWSGGGAGDTYLVHVKEKFYDAKFYVAADPPSRFVIPGDAWTSLTESNAGEAVTVEIERLSGGAAHQAMTEQWTIAQGSLRGSIYYWAVNTGQLMKIAPAAASPVVVFDSGPADQLGTPAPSGYNGATPPWETGGNNKRCVACHTVSKDGSTIAAVFEKQGSTASPWGTVDLTQPTPAVEQMTPYTSSTIYLALTPDGSHAVQNDVDLSMHLADAKTGAPIASALDTLGDKVADPAFSPDGKLLAFAGNVTGAYPVEYTQADLDVMKFDPVALSFSDRTTLVPGGSQEIAFPSFSPDSKWIFYQRGDYSRAKYGTDSIGHNDLFVADVAGQAGQISLDNASGASLGASNQHLAYQPTVNPIAVGGYTWVVFVSPRDYGNRMLSTSNPTYENRKQLWVAAIDNNPEPGKDPSHPAFWLPGQDLATTNMSGYWALEACHQTGTSCDEGFECCTGFCQDDGHGKLACSSDSGSCSKIGDKCTTASDCCGASDACIGGFCAQRVPH